MKRIIALIISLTVLASSFSFCLSASAVQTTDIAKTRIASSDTYYEYSVSDKTLTLSGNGNIPNMINNDASQPWFYWRSDGSIERVVIGEGITGIGSYVLYQVCAPEVQLPSTLKTIGNYALAYNDSIESYELPFGVKSIGASSFENCISLKSIDLPDTLTSIAKNSLKQCYKLESVKIPYSVSSIGNYAFHRCLVLESVSFESLSSPVKIGSYAFMNCPKLSELSVPLGATMGTYAFGFNDSKKKYEGVSMKLFSGSDAMAYAKARAIPYELIDVIPLEMGVVNTNEYIEETTQHTYNYSFVPKTTQIYNIYSTGEVDLTAIISDENGEIGRSDDISKDNLNFCLSYELEAGKEYSIAVSSVKSVGEYSVIVYPDEILSFDILGELSFRADEGELNNESNRVFEINDAMLENFILTVSFGGDYQDRIYYSNMYFDNREISLADKQSETPFTCGENKSYIAIGEIESSFNVYVEHSYEEEVIPYTVDDDGYSVFTCILCGNSYKDNYVPTPAVTVSGTAVLMEKPDGSHSHNVPYPYASFFANDRTYFIDENGKWSVNTFDDLDLVFENKNGENIELHIDVENEDVEYGAVVFQGYDFNGDGYVNAKDYVVFLKEKKELNEDYWNFAYNFFGAKIR